LKDSQYHLTSWRADPVYQAPYTQMNGLEVVPRTGYVQGQMPASPPFHGHNNGGGWNFSTVKYQHGTDTNHGVSHDHMSTFEPQAPANGSLLAQNDMRSMFPKHATVNGPYNGNEGEETTGPGSLKDKDQTPRDTARNSPHLPMLPEEPNTFISEEDDLLPAIENFQITGEAVLGSTLQASGISINGTSLCVFQWVRHFEDGTACYIEGAGQPEYTITADDVDACIAIQCTPLDKRGRQGNVVEVFVNETNKITCDPTMQEQIESYFSAGQTVFDVHLLNAVLDSWESATLTLKRSNYEIRTVKLRRVVINEKYNSNISITVPCGSSAQFVITSSDGNEHVLSTHEDDLRLRDMLVITMRLFQKQDQRNLEDKVKWQTL